MVISAFSVLRAKGDFLKQTLEMLGYTVLAAKNGKHALELSNNINGEFDLLLTDVVMPKMNGGELAKKIQTQHPAVKILFMSGYTDDRLSLQTLFEKDVPFLEKPLTVDTIATSIRKVLAPVKEK
jgi:two-component system cell cycle sensor histidine kinase/response regulator CckA